MPQAHQIHGTLSEQARFILYISMLQYPRTPRECNWGVHPISQRLPETIGPGDLNPSHCAISSEHGAYPFRLPCAILVKLPVDPARTPCRARLSPSPPSRAKPAARLRREGCGELWRPGRYAVVERVRPPAVASPTPGRMDSTRPGRLRAEWRWYLSGIFSSTVLEKSARERKGRKARESKTTLSGITPVDIGQMWCFP
jgi:hypothetical protein